MKNQLRLVFKLNRLDLKVQEFENRLEKIPQRRRECEAELEERRRTSDLKAKEIEEIEKTRRDKEGEISLSENRLREFQGKLSQIKTNKEYQAALKEISETKKGNKAIEDQVLDLMTRIEGLKKEREGLEQTTKDQEAVYRKELSDLEAEEKKLQAAVQEIEQEKAKILSLVDSVILSQYQKIRRSRRDAVTFVEEGACQGCHMHLQPQLVIELQKLKMVHSCPSCHRILYLKEWQDQEASS